MSLQSLQIGTVWAWFSSFFLRSEGPAEGYVDQPELSVTELPELFGGGGRFVTVSSLREPSDTSVYCARLYNEATGVEIRYTSYWMDGRLIEAVNIIHADKVGMHFLVIQGWVRELQRPYARAYRRVFSEREVHSFGEFMELLYEELKLPHPFL